MIDTYNTKLCPLLRTPCREEECAWYESWDSIDDDGVGPEGICCMRFLQMPEPQVNFLMEDEGED